MDLKSDLVVELVLGPGLRSMSPERSSSSWGCRPPPLSEKTVSDCLWTIFVVDLGRREISMPQARRFFVVSPLAFPLVGPLGNAPASRVPSSALEDVVLRA